MTRYTLLLLPLLLTGCDFGVKNPVEGEERVTLNADASGQVAFDLPFAQGKIKLPAGMMDRGDVDLDGVKLMPGAKVNGFNVDAQDKGSTEVRLSFHAPVSPAEGRAYFVKQFRDRGVNAVASGDAVTGIAKDGTRFEIRLAPAQGGSQGTILLHPDKSA